MEQPVEATCWHPRCGSRRLQARRRAVVPSSVLKALAVGMARVLELHRPSIANRFTLPIATATG